MAQQHTLTAALAYAARGWAVFPLRANSKKPAVPGHRADQCDRSDPACRDGHRGWEQRASTDPAVLGRWWRPGSRYGIGIATGPSNLVVVDLDTPHLSDVDQRSGAAVLCSLADRAGATTPVTWTVSTPRGGWHLYFAQPRPSDGQAPIGSSSGRVPHIDVRAVGGYVAAPPTRIPGGRYGHYTVTRQLDPVELPGWLAHRMAPARHDQQALPNGPARARVVPASGRRRDQGQARARSGGGVRPVGRLDRWVAAAIEAEAALVRSAFENRNNTLFAAARALGELVGAGALTEHEATTALAEAASVHHGIRQFTAAEAARTIASGLHRGRQDPRHLPTTGGAA